MFKKININSNSTIKDLQACLNLHFPFLRFEFYRNSENGNMRGNTKLLRASLNVFAVTNLHENIAIKIFDDKKIAEIKNDFEKIGLTAVLYRKSGNVWVKISLTDEWSLRMQNTEGENFSV